MEYEFMMDGTLATKRLWREGSKMTKSHFIDLGIIRM